MLRCGRTQLLLLAFWFGLSLQISCSTPPKEVEVAPADTGRVQLAKEHLTSLKTTYFTQLNSALSSKPPESSIKVCRLPYENTERPVQGYQVSAGRSSQHLRNPLNAPEPWMKSWFEDFEKNRKLNGFVQLGENEWAYIEPIRAEASCLQCHSSKTSEAVLTALREFYLQDDSLNFSSGDLVGLYWVRLRTKN